MAKQRKYLAFDIETAAEIPASALDWRPYRPLGISCAATLAGDEAGVRVWHGQMADGSPAPRMNSADAVSLVDYLASMAKAGYTILTWNVDLMFQVFCRQGYRVALDKAAQGMGIPGKSKGISGIMAPRLWAEGRHQEILGYVSQDVQTTLQLATKCELCGQFRWITQKGTRQRIDLPEGWLTARAAFRLPQPDTSWMRNPPSRGEFIAWLK